MIFYVRFICLNKLKETGHILTWHEILLQYFFISEPSEPLGFRNITRTSYTVTFRWQPPDKPNGYIQDYKVCSNAIQLAFKAPINLVILFQLACLSGQILFRYP